MTTVELIRLSTNADYGTLGILKIDKEPFCVTLEPSDRLNAVNESSIPTGQYTCKPYLSERHGDVYEVLNVHARVNILFHRGNVQKDTSGCILLGNYFSKLTGTTRSIVNSGATFKRFHDRIGKEKFLLTITESY